MHEIRVDYASVESLVPYVDMKTLTTLILPKTRSAKFGSDFMRRPFKLFDPNDLLYFGTRQ